LLDEAVLLKWLYCGPRLTIPATNPKMGPPSDRCSSWFGVAHRGAKIVAVAHQVITAEETVRQPD